MDLQGNNMQPELGKLEQIVYQFLLKCLHIILDSRVPLLRQNDKSGELSIGSRARKSDKWFNLALGDRPSALENLNFWHRNLMDPMIIDIILVHEVNGSSVETVIERWVVQYECPRVMTSPTGDTSSSYKKTYQKSIILFRALYSQMRLLPTHKIFRQLSTSSHSCNFDIVYKVSSFSDPFSRAEMGMMEEHSFTPVEAIPGRLNISVTHRTTLSDFNLECSISLPPRIITDYVGSPNTDPLRSFPAEKGVRPTSFPLREIASESSSAPLERPHTWTSGFHKAAPFVQNHPYGGSPQVYRGSPKPYDFPSSPSPTDNYNVRYHNYRIQQSRQRSTSYDEYQLSPPFSSSPSPSPPTYLHSGNPIIPIKTRMRSETAPVSIPHPVMGFPRNPSPNFSDPSRNSLPPLSPRRYDASSHESPSGIRSFRKIEVSKTGQKIVRDSKDDSGRFSGLLSSSDSPRIGVSRTSSSRLSFQDDLDDGDFSCPFDVDDVDPPDAHSSQNMDGRSFSESPPTSLPMVKKSQDAAVGVLVHMLRTAPPLRQDPSCYSSHSLKAELDGGLATASGFFMPRKTTDALEELRSYREMRDLLLSKSGTQILKRNE